MSDADDPLARLVATHIYSPPAADAEAVLGRVTLFESVKPRDLKKLAREAHEISFDAGTTLTADHGFGTTFFVVADGSVGIEVGGLPVRTVGPGEFFGEMALIDRDTRSATARALEATRCLVFSRRAFRPFAHDHPDVAWALLELMVARLRQAEARSGA